MPANVAERRQARRYPVQLRIELEDGHGVTRDVSPSGVYFETRKPLTPSEVIQFLMVMDHARPDAPVRLGCAGEIVRVERHAETIGVAVAFNSHWLVP